MTLLQIVQQHCDAAIQAFIVQHKFNTSLTVIQNALSSKDLQVKPASNKKFGHFQFDGAMKIAGSGLLGGESSRNIAAMIKEQLEINSESRIIFEKVELPPGPGFINLTLNSSYIQKFVNEQLTDPRHGCASAKNPQQVVIDFSSPNIAKEMHVGHLRSTIIGDCIARVLEFTGHKVLRLNHVGDWGTQFGMLIAYLKQQKADLNTIQKLTLTDLVKAYKLAKIEFEQDPKFKQNAQLEVVELQQGNPDSKAIWDALCAASRTAFEEIYSILDIKLQERGESFYNPMLAGVIADFEAKNLITISDGAKCVYLDGFTNRENEPLPLIVQKSDGGYNYATTDLAALKHRVQQEHATWIIYVTDAGQSQHFSMVFAAGRKVGYYQAEKVRIDHVPFGLVLRSDGKKFQTRSGETERLFDLLQSAIDKAQMILTERNNPEFTADDIKNMAQILGLNAIKYADLSNNRVSDYTFNLDRMLQFEGNTAAFLAYAYVRIQSIKRKVNIDVQALIKQNTKIQLQQPEEIELGLHLLQFPDVIENFTRDLLPNRLTDYLFVLAEKYHVFFHNCRVEGVPEQNSRLLLCEAVARILAQGLDLLGLRPLQKM